MTPRRSERVGRLIESRLTHLAACALLAATACTTAPRSEAPRIAPAELLAGNALHASEQKSSTIVDPQDVLAVSPEMKTFLEAHVDRKVSDSIKLRQLVAAIIDSKTFGVEYDEETRTAAETYRMRRGNCLSFSNLFVAMARNVGLNVEYQEVDIPPDWTLDKDTYVLNQHINVFVNLGADGRRVVDFNIGDFKSSYELRKITDARARAHYYNNVGVARMQAGDTGAALACFRRALVDNDPLFSPAWTNLGTLYLRNGLREQAEAAYLQALQTDTDLVAMSDLARLYEMRGDAERAAAYQKKVVYHRRLNPYYRYELARRAYAAHEYDEAIGHLKYAIRKRPKEDQFYFLLGLTYLQKGYEPAARFWFTQAQKVAATDAQKRKYSSKVDILLQRRDSQK